MSRQCEILELNRTGVYYTPCPVNEEDLILMCQIDEFHLKHPFYGARGLPNSSCGMDLKSAECTSRR
jgi:putative transposase